MTSDLWCKSSSCDHWDVFSRSLGRDLENPSSFQFGVPFFLDLAHAWMLLWNRCCCSIMMMMAAAVKLQCCLQRKQLDKVWFSTIKMVWVPWSSIFQRDLALQRCWFYQCFPNLFSTPMLNKPVDSPISRYPNIRNKRHLAKIQTSVNSTVNTIITLKTYSRVVKYVLSACL